MEFRYHTFMLLVLPLLLSWLSETVQSSCDGCTFTDPITKDEKCYALGQHFPDGCLVRQCVKRIRPDNVYHFVRIKKFSCKTESGCHDWKSVWDEKVPNSYCAVRKCVWWRKQGNWPYTFMYKNRILKSLCIDDDGTCHEVEEGDKEEKPFNRTIRGKVYNNCFCKEVNKEILTSCKLNT